MVKPMAHVPMAFGFVCPRHRLTVNSDGRCDKNVTRLKLPNTVGRLEGMLCCCSVGTEAATNKHMLTNCHILQIVFQHFQTPPIGHSPWQVSVPYPKSRKRHSHRANRASLRSSRPAARVAERAKWLAKYHGSLFKRDQSARPINAQRV